MNISIDSNYNDPISVDSYTMLFEIQNISKRTMGLKRIDLDPDADDKEIEDKIFNELITALESIDFPSSLLIIRQPTSFFKGSTISTQPHATRASNRIHQWKLNKQYNYNFPTDVAITDRDEWDKYITKK